MHPSARIALVLLLVSSAAWAEVGTPGSPGYLGMGGGAPSRDDMVSAARHHERMLDDPTTQLSDAQAQEILRLQDEIDAIIARSTPGAGPGACYNEAYKILARDAALALCEGAAGVLPVACYNEAQRKQMTSDDAVRLCRAGGTPERVRCAEEAGRRTTLVAAIDSCLGH